MPRAPEVLAYLPGSIPRIPAPDQPLVNMKLPGGVRESDALASQIYSPQGEYSVSFSCSSQLLIVDNWKTVGLQKSRLAATLNNLLELAAMNTCDVMKASRQEIYYFP